ncbi:MAG: NAD(P)-binding protein [Gemmatimonadota bacterium]|nr:NAD(P)-binding protein [Gemmatimonadota bacterium]MDE3174372.1 NAD(P)-binding protein [Gemmatimonadota bacterium]MDE3216496.1 NAD(P)-binding protein [Gemmatimonadota bacterium]
MTGSANRPVRIAGAGPAGLAAAIVLARAGRAVEVLERRSRCGARFSGDLQGLENWSGGGDALAEFRALGITTDFHAAPCRHGVQTDGVRDDAFAFDTPAFYIVKRGDVPGSLDRALAAQALALGVDIRFDTPCPEGTADIEATGPRGRAPFAIDTGIVFETDAPDTAIALLNDDAAPGGYAYLLVTGGYGCCCTMLFDDFPSIHRRFALARELLVERRGIAVRNPRAVGGLGHVRARGSWWSGVSRCVGEAAGLQDFLWGFGIRLAVRSGALAAESVLTGADYAAAAEAAFSPRLRIGVANRWLWEHARAGRYALVRGALHAAGPMRLLGWMHREHWWHRLVAPLGARGLRTRYPVVFDPSAAMRAASAAAPDTSAA